MNATAESRAPLMFPLLIALRIAGSALLRNRLRATLTTLGIAIGTGAVISTVAIGEGATAQIQQQLLMLGDNMIWVEAGGRNVGAVRTGTATTPKLVVADMRAAVQSIPALKSCSPMVDAQIQVIYGNQNWRTTYRGVSPEYLSIRRLEIASGEIFSPQEVASAANVCLLGQSLVERLFPGEEPVAKTLRLRSLPFKVIGTLARKGVSAQGMDQDDFVLVPYTTGQRKLKGAMWLNEARPRPPRRCQRSRASSWRCCASAITSALARRTTSASGSPKT